jgi:hypothetical protein
MNSPDPAYRDAKSPTSFQDGLEFQDFVCAQLAKHAVVLQNLASKKYQFEVGENLQGYEIKLDNNCTLTGRLSIEVAEKTRDDDSLPWTPSGILRNDNTWLYIQVNYSVLYIFAKRFLLNYYDSKKDIPGFIVAKRGTVKTFYVSNDNARKHAAKVLEF